MHEDAAIRYEKRAYKTTLLSISGIYSAENSNSIQKADHSSS